MFANSPPLLVKVSSNTTQTVAPSLDGISAVPWFAPSQGRIDCLDLRGRKSPATTTTTTATSLQSPPVHLSLFPDLPGGPTDSHCTATGAS